MPRYAPAREDGLKPYVVTMRAAGKLSERLEYADTAPAARCKAMAGDGRYALSARRATTDDVAKREASA